VLDVSLGTLSAAALRSRHGEGAAEGGNALSYQSVEPIVLVGIASAMLFPWRVVTRRKCTNCGERSAKRGAGCVCRPQEAA
jgi:hypothetical protein